MSKDRRITASVLAWFVLGLLITMTQGWTIGIKEHVLAYVVSLALCAAVVAVLYVCQEMNIRQAEKDIVEKLAQRADDQKIAQYLFGIWRKM